MIDVKDPELFNKLKKRALDCEGVVGLEGDCVYIIGKAKGGIVLSHPMVIRIEWKAFLQQVGLTVANMCNLNVAPKQG